MFVLLIASSAFAETKNLYFIKWKSDLSQRKKQKRDRLSIKYNFKIESDQWKIALSASVAKKLSSLGLVDFIEKDRVLKLNPIVHPEPKETLSLHSKMTKGEASLWHLERIRAFEAWQFTKGKKDTVVAVCDSGVQPLAQFEGRLLPGRNFVDGDIDDTAPRSSHGTAVSAFIAAKNIEGNDYMGVAPNISILPGRIVGRKGIPTSAMLACIRWAADQGAKVINVSMTGVEKRSSFEAAKYAEKKGALVVWAAGNRNVTKRRWRDRKEIVAVGGTNSSDNRYRSSWRYGSRRGPFVDIAAPGQSVQYLKPSGELRVSNGTSYSAPLVSGLAALIFSINPDFTPAQVREIIYSTAKRLGRSWSFGHGLIDSFEALKKADQLNQSLLVQ